MNNETNRLAQLIATAADKELGTRPDGQPRRQDKAAALAIEADYLFIRRAELPEVREGRHPSTYVVDGTDIMEPDVRGAKKFALLDLAIWQHLENAANAARQEAEQRMQARREELAGSLAGGLYKQVPASLQEAIDRIIELEGKAA